MNKRLANKIRYYKRLYTLKYTTTKLAKIVFYDAFIRPFNREKAVKISWKEPAKYLAQRDFGLKFSKDSVVTEFFLERDYIKYKEFIPSKEDTVVDVGVQYGDYAILCNKYYGSKVFAFEPLKNNIRIIKENLALNKIKENFYLYPVALGSKQRKISIAYDDDMMNSRGEGKKQLTIVRTLDSYRLHPDILKIDVEGFEMDVLNGAQRTIKKYHPRIIIETHNRSLEKQVRRTLEGLGYKIAHEGRAVYSATKGFDKVTNLFFY